MARRILFAVALGLAAGVGAVNFAVWSQLAATDAALDALEASRDASAVGAGHRDITFDIDDWNDD